MHSELCQFDFKRSEISKTHLTIRTAADVVNSLLLHPNQLWLLGHQLIGT
jgi:hypothetical protein